MIEIIAKIVVKSVFHQIERGGVLNIVDDSSPLKYDIRHIGEIVIHQHDVAHVFRCVAAGGYADGAIRFLHGEDIIYAVARHCYGVAFRLYRLDQNRLLLGGNATEYCIFVGDGSDLLVVQPLQRNIFVSIGNCRPGAQLLRR